MMLYGSVSEAAVRVASVPAGGLPPAFTRAVSWLARVRGRIDGDAGARDSYGAVPAAALPPELRREGYLTMAMLCEWLAEHDRREAAA